MHAKNDSYKIHQKPTFGDALEARIHRHADRRGRRPISAGAAVGPAGAGAVAGAGAAGGKARRERDRRICSGDGGGPSGYFGDRFGQRGICGGGG